MLYPVSFLKQSNASYKIEVPDLPGCNASASSIEEGFKAIKHAITSHLMILAEYGEKIPNGSEIAEFEGMHSKAIWGIIEIDITPYLGRSHKINVTLPELLIKQIDDRVTKSENYKSRSGFIASACIGELKRVDK